MMRLVFIRHAATDCFLSHLAGRDANVHLSAAGRVQGRRLAHSLKRQGIGKIYSSPQPRARETAEFLGELLGEALKSRRSLTRSIMANGPGVASKSCAASSGGAISIRCVVARVFPVAS